jgi:hypothetical protein
MVSTNLRDRGHDAGWTKTDTLKLHSLSPITPPKETVEFELTTQASQRKPDRETTHRQIHMHEYEPYDPPNLCQQYTLQLHKPTQCQHMHSAHMAPMLRV